MNQKIVDKWAQAISDYVDACVLAEIMGDDPELVPFDFDGLRADAERVDETEH